MNILGISCYYHDAAAALVSDGQVIAAAEEERFTRKKHDNRFPESAISFCLGHGGLSPQQLDAVCFYEKPLLKLERILAVGGRRPGLSDDLISRQLSHALNERLFLPEVIRRKIGYTGRIVYTDHHLAHAASAFYISGFDQAAILTVDGVGEWATTAQFVGLGNEIRKLREIRYPHSLGLFYSTLTAFLGFKVNNDEYKVMGLASYGKPRYTDRIAKLITLHADGSFRLNLDYFSFTYDGERMFSEAMIDLLGEPRLAHDPVTQYHKDLAASVQEVLRDAMVRLGCAFYDAAGGIENICLAGGVSLNCVANTHFLAETPFTNICIQPAAGDGGAALGAALYAYHTLVDVPRVPSRHTSLLGPEYSSEEISEFLDGKGATFTKIDNGGIYGKVAELIHQNQIIAWFQGRMEYGPRALGNRSILANPCHPEMKDILNRRVKFREDFRPFAPAVLAERAGEYFDFPGESPFMLFTPEVKPGLGERIPAVTHVDNTARIQTVAQSDNPRFYRLIEEFGRLSGVPVVINTSFNIRGEPIVCTMDDAYNCFLKTDIDYLAMGDFLVEKEI